jgi:hypothetical protein
MVWIPAVVLPVIFIGVMVFLLMRIRTRGQIAKAEFKNRYGEQIRLITGGIIFPPSRVPGVLACLPNRIQYKSLTSIV